MDFKALETKWQAAWAKAKLFEAEPDPKRPKFFVTFPYPYVNGYLHVGHFYTLLRCDVTARYKRMAGFNVLFPQAWHATGGPIEAAAARIRENEPRQLAVMAEMGFGAEEIKAFADPKHWPAFFAKATYDDFVAAGISVDWRRQFITTELNPHYDAFIRWQFTKLRQLGYVAKGRHPIVWCPKERAAVPDHNRIEGEGEIPQELVLLKFPSSAGTLVAATLRAETVFGQTNLWVNPEFDYAIAEVDGERWIVLESCAAKLAQQEHAVKIVGRIKGRELVGQTALAPGIEREIPILPAWFIDPEKGTGIVTSVPSDAPDDWIALLDLQRDAALCARYGLDHAAIKDIKPIAIIKTAELGELPAVDIIAKLGIKSQHDRVALEEAKRIVYKAGFYAGVMTGNAKDYAGMPVERAKEAVKAQLLAAGRAALFYELTGKVICRCLSEAIVKIVTDQWFLRYSDPEWKEKARKALSQCRLFPEAAREQFSRTITWLRDWACAREHGLGSRLPWDPKWVIESLSDSTIYPAYYTIAHKIQQLDPGLLDEAFFDYVFLGKGNKPELPGLDAEQLRAEFLYWYPVDFRNSGKDLIQNHLTFYLFTHAALFPKQHWPAGIGVNGWITVDGRKMSKSLGNFLLIRDVLRYGADSARIAMLYGGEGLDDANFDRELAFSLRARLEELHALCAHYGKHGRQELALIDRWLDNKVSAAIVSCTEAMEATAFRSALQAGFFNLQAAIRRYLKRVDKPNSAVLDRAIESVILLLAPFAPHICEECWSAIGKKGFVSSASWPKPGPLERALEHYEALVDAVEEDIRTVLRLAKLEKPRRITLLLAQPWKYLLHEALSKARERKPEILARELAKDSRFKQHMPEITKLLPKLVTAPPELALTREEEHTSLDEAVPYLSRIFGCELKIVHAESSEHPKARAAMPGKPAIVVE